MQPPINPRRIPFVIAVTLALVAAVVAVAVAFAQAGSPTPVGAFTPTPVPTPTPKPAVIPFADCSTATFGPALAPLDEPPDVHSYSAVPATTIDKSKLYEVTITTAKGVIVLCLQPDLAPTTVNVFVTLTRNHFYDGIPFARIGPSSTVPDIIQGGDPNCIGNVPAAPATPSGTCGEGGPGFAFADEPVHQQYVTGVIAMANTGVGTNSNGSQFFITKSDETSLWPLNAEGLSYNLFGKVVSGQSVVDSIVQGDVMDTVTVSEQT
ncbi:MAG: peptidylprolyl isomerase [Candidatus Dormibacteria bacterium]